MAKISFDFDGTINDHFDGSGNPFKYKVREILKKLIADGHEIFIVTRRKNETSENHIVFEVAEEIGVERNKIFFTNREWKFSQLSKLGIDFHIDDDIYDIMYINMNTKKIQSVHLRNEDSIEEFYKLCNTSDEENN